MHILKKMIRTIFASFTVVTTHTEQHSEYDLNEQSVFDFLWI